MERWDWLVYRLAHRSIDRMMQRGHGGYAYLFELHLRNWRALHPIPPHVMYSTENFFFEMTGQEPVWNPRIYTPEEIEDVDGPVVQCINGTNAS